MKLKKVLLSLVLIAALPFSMKVGAKGEINSLTTKDCVVIGTSKDEVRKKIGQDLQDHKILIKFNKENQTPKIPNVIYLQIFGELLTNILIDNINEEYKLDLSEFKIKNYKDINLNNILFAFGSSMITENDKPTSESIKKLVNSKNWKFYLAENTFKKLNDEQINIIGKYVGCVIGTGLDKVYKEKFQPKIEKYIDEGKLDEILDGIIEKYNKLKGKINNEANFKERHPEYPEGFLDEITRIKSLPKKEQKTYFGNILFDMSFEFNQ